MLSYRLYLAGNCENSCAGLGKKNGRVKCKILTNLIFQHLYHFYHGNKVMVT